MRVWGDDWVVRAGSEYRLVLYELDADGFADTEEREKKLHLGGDVTLVYHVLLTPVDGPIR